MSGRDYDSFLAALRLYRKQIDEAVIVIQRLVKTEKSSANPPSWAKTATDHEEDDGHDHITYKQMLETLEQNQEHVDEALVAIERLARGRAKASAKQPQPAQAGRVKRKSDKRK